MLIHGFVLVKTWLLIVCDTAFYAIIRLSLQSLAESIILFNCFQFWGFFAVLSLQLVLISKTNHVLVQIPVALGKFWNFFSFSPETKFFKENGHPSLKIFQKID